MLLSRVVEKSVEIAETPDRFVNDLLAERPIADVTRKADAFSPGLFHQRTRLRRVPFFVEIRKRNIRAFQRCRNCGSAADTAVATRNENDAVLQRAARFVVGM